MTMMDSRIRQQRKIMCPVCATTMQPEMVPWLQHAIGCPVRTAELTGYERARTPKANPKSSLAHSCAGSL